MELSEGGPDHESPGDGFADFGPTTSAPTTSTTTTTLSEDLRQFFDACRRKSPLAGAIQSFVEKADALHRLLQERGMAVTSGHEERTDLATDIHAAQVEFNVRRTYLIIGAETQFIDIPKKIDALLPTDVIDICRYFRS